MFAASERCLLRNAIIMKKQKYKNIYSIKYQNSSTFQNIGIVWRAHTTGKADFCPAPFLCCAPEGSLLRNMEDLPVWMLSPHMGCRIEPLVM